MTQLPTAGEVAVYRISPEVGKYYMHAESTRTYDHSIHFTTNDSKYVGMFVRQERYGSGDGSEIYACFICNGVEEKIQYSYRCNTCFIETNPV